MKTSFLFLSFVLLTLSGRGQAQAQTQTQTQTQTGTAPGNSLKLLPVVWHQQSAEYRALCYQAFNLAALRIEKVKPSKKKRYAIITDVDETVLDNSYYEARNLADGTEYIPETWKEWTDYAVATPLPGAVEFLNHAKKKGFEIFYISNREISEVRSTMENLRKYDFPDADEAHMLFMKDTSSKEARRKQVMDQYTVVLLLGDNLNDFTSFFEKRSSNERFEETDKVKEEWGRKFIVLPNALYGEWENALYDYKRGITPAEREKMLREHLTGY
jgi:5'-nucleotidase (lipoprotein e(P4) family)